METRYPVTDSEGDGSSASGGKHVPIKGATNFDKESTRKEESFSDSNRCNEHAWLGEQDQLDWLNCEKLSIESKRKECPFLTKRERFKNEFMRRVVPWDKIKVSWDKFPYHIRERIVRAVARDLQVPLLVLDSNVLAPYVRAASDFGQECASESDTDDGHVESGEECTSESEAEDGNDLSNEEWTSSNEGKSGESDDDVDVRASAEALKKLVPCSLEEFAKVCQ
ncbi:hypothetical protein BHE74_00001145 [Ensete ventricosum]|nr:hypothetical protein GW17_00018398 [Ensete ventricosum]RWW89810.1 hypothetical protein BHE74_00001145 [Ensete ventricosum]RZR96757.1 hypothetical protein BHM03_00025820 [Ensete ventricosum]